MKSKLIAGLLFTGALLAQSFQPTSTGPYFVALGDLNGDGFPDAVLPCRGELLLPSEKRPGNDVLTVYLTAGSPKFSERRDFTIGYGPYTAIVDDLDGDGRNDVAVVNFQANDGRDLSILWGIPGKDVLAQPTHVKVEGGPFAYDKNRTLIGEPVYPTPGLTSLVVVDADRDGRKDLVAVAWSSDFFVLFRNAGQRSFKQSRNPLSPGPRDVVAADFSGDGITDLAFTIYSSNLIEIWKADGRGHFAPWQKFHSQGMVPYHLKAGDVDKDGRPDLVVGNRGPSDNVVLFRNEGAQFRYAGSWNPGTRKVAEQTADEIRDVLLFDEDGDGHLDLAAACHVSHKVVVWRGTGETGFGKAFSNRRVMEFPGKGPRSLAWSSGGWNVAFFDSSELGFLPGGK